MREIERLHLSNSYMTYATMNAGLATVLWLLAAYCATKFMFAAALIITALALVAICFYLHYDGMATDLIKTFKR